MLEALILCFEFGREDGTEPEVHKIARSDFAVRAKRAARRAAHRDVRAKSSRKVAIGSEVHKSARMRFCTARQRCPVGVRAMDGAHEILSPDHFSS